MSCGKDFHSDNCVCDVLREIARVQDDIVDEPGCDTSCERSIRDLLGDRDDRRDKDTVPLILYCKGNCKPFKAFGVTRRNKEDVKASFFFRVEKVMDNCCAVLELLRDPSDVKPPKSQQGKPRSKNPDDPADQKTGHLKGTGICITVDLKCFCHVTCLPAISAF